MILPFIPGVGVEQGGARIWVQLGPINFQPGEATKIVLALFFAAYLVEKRELLRTSTRRIGPFHVPDPKYLGPILIVWGVSLMVMIAQRDLGTSLLFFALFVVMLWVATERPSWLVVGAVLFGLGAWFAFANFGHVENRVDYYGKLKRALTANGRLAIVDFFKRELPVGPGVEMKIAKEDMVAELRAAGFELKEEFDYLPYQYYLVFESNR